MGGSFLPSLHLSTEPGPLQKRSSGLLFSDAVRFYLRHARGVMTLRSYVSRANLLLAQMLPEMGNRPLSAVTSAEIQHFLDRRVHLSGATRNRYLTAFSTIFRHLMDLDLFDNNPARRIRRCREEIHPLTVPETRPQERLLGLLPEPLRTFFLLLLDTGLRLGEALALEWTDLDGEAGTLYVRRSKARRPRLVGVTQRLSEALGRHREVQAQAGACGSLVFPEARAARYYVRHWWRVAFKRAAGEIGFPRLRIHDLRHLYAVNLVRNGMDLPTVQTVLGHTTLVSTFRYAEYADNSAALRAARALDALHGRERGQSAPAATEGGGLVTAPGHPPRPAPRAVPLEGP